jgi:transposase
VLEEETTEHLQPLAVSLNCRHRACVRAYSVDLRQKIVEAVQRGMTKAQAARAFGVGISSVKRYVNLAQEGESLVPKKLLEEDLHRRPGATYQQRAKLLFELLGVQVSEATLCRAVKRLGYTRKKDQWVRANGTSG